MYHIMFLVVHCRKSKVHLAWESPFYLALCSGMVYSRVQQVMSTLESILPEESILPPIPAGADTGGGGGGGGGGSRVSSAASAPAGLLLNRSLILQLLGLRPNDILAWHYLIFSIQKLLVLFKIHYSPNFSGPAPQTP